MIKQKTSIQTLVTNLAKHCCFPKKYIQLDVLEEDMVAKFEKEWKDIEWSLNTFQVSNINDVSEFEFMKVYRVVENHPRIWPLY